jgi:uncharacterized protein (UPF0335 family)
MEKEPKMDIINEADKDPKNQKLHDDRLVSFMERIERLEEEKKGIQSDINDIFAEAKSSGYDVKAMRAVLKLRKMDTLERQEQEYLVEEYKRMLGIC